jgi:hypothetical protein
MVKLFAKRLNKFGSGHVRIKKKKRSIMRFWLLQPSSANKRTSICPTDSCG